MKIPIALLSIAMAGALMAQTTTAQKTAPAPTQTKDHAAAVNRSGWMVQRLTKQLNLTADQQTRVKAIFADAKQQAQSLTPRLREERSELKAAVKTDSESKIDQITQQNAQLMAQREALHVKAMAKVYATLTPDQKVKFDQIDARRVARVKHNHNGQARS